MTAADKDGSGVPRTAALWPALVALAYVLVGVAFFADPSQAEETGSDAYWTVLADAGFGRQAFLLAFAMVGILGLGGVGSIDAVLRPRPGGALRFAFVLGYLGYAVTAVSYFRILSGEAGRAQAFSEGDEATRAAIASFSIGLDPDGWLLFGATGVFLAVVNVVALARGHWPTWLAGLGVAIAGLSLTAWLGLLLDRSALVNVAVAVGGIVLGPLWWAGLAVAISRDRAMIGGGARSEIDLGAAAGSELD